MAEPHFDPRMITRHAWRCCRRAATARVGQSPKGVLNRCALAVDLRTMNPNTLLSAISAQWDSEIVAQLTDYVRIPSKSPQFDPLWEKNGHIERVIGLAEAWVSKQPVRGLKAEIVRLPGRTPLLYFDVPPTGNGSERTVLLYGHLDKQPEMSGWRDGYGPWNPLFEDGKLYGRGSADDGYAVFAALSAVSALQTQD